MIHYFQSVDSTMDAAFSLADSGELGIFDSVLAASQTRGRGQLRKRWTSLDGNLFASVRLPRSLPFNTSLGSIAVAAFIFPVLARYS
ncbi:MAG: hypothetical protein K2H64_09325, partial [Desulfovibrio sp.]|nr:hypothetical protein [Desulfovibrio sp.]